MLEVNKLWVREKEGKILLKDISLKLEKGKIIGLTGQSGSGKTTVIRSILGMLHEDCRVIQGSISIDGNNLSGLSRKKRRDLCGREIGYIPQMPMTAFDNRIKIGKEMMETFCVRLNISKEKAENLARDKLADVNLMDVKRVMNAYPTELSGGMLQRIAIAILLGLVPEYILADEPTAALDEENQDLVLEIMKKQMPDKGILLVSHDINALCNMCSQVYVIGGGELLESGKMETLLKRPNTSWMKEFAAISKTKKRGEWKWMELS